MFKRLQKKTLSIPVFKESIYIKLWIDKPIKIMIGLK